MKTNLLSNIVAILQGVFLISGAWWGYTYYTGRLKFSGEAEKRRKRKAKKYGVFFVIASTVCLCSGIYSIFNALYIIFN